MTLTPYEKMTQQVERETGSDSATWSMYDKRWDRVCWLTRELLGIPHSINRGQEIRRAKRNAIPSLSNSEAA